MPAAVAVVFKTFARLFNVRWEKTHNDPKAPAVWERSFTLARLTPNDVSAGLAKASQLTWPPSAGEFIALCRPSLPTESQGLAEAVRVAATASWSTHVWSHEVVRATARDVGAWDLRNMREFELRRVWANAWKQLAERFNRGESLDPPARKALEHRVDRERQATTKEPTQAGLAAAAEIAALLVRSPSSAA